MNLIERLPPAVKRLVECHAMAEFATVSMAGVPIDTPTYYFPTDDLSSLDIATGIAYPAKADRARRNPRVGMMVEGGADEPVVLVRGRAAVRDADLSANARRYIAETGFEGIGYGLPWSEARKAVWYWTRIIVQNTPETIMWWDTPADMDRAPHVLRVPEGHAFPQSDPAPAGKPSKGSEWPQRPWQHIAKDGLARPLLPPLTLCDADGYPLPVRARAVELVGDRFRLDMPGWLPWTPEGKGSLSFIGIENFVGEVTREGGAVWLAVERALPQLPLIMNPRQVLQPDDELKATLLARLTTEAARRGGQGVAEIPEALPEPTRLAKVRFDFFGTSAPTVEGTT